MKKPLFPGISFLSIAFNVITFSNIKIVFLPFNLILPIKILSNISDGVRYSELRVSLLRLSEKSE